MAELKYLKVGDDVLLIGPRRKGVHGFFHPNYPKRVAKVTKQCITLNSGNKFRMDGSPVSSYDRGSKLVCFSEQGLKDLQAERERKQCEREEREAYDRQPEVVAARMLTSYDTEDWLKLHAYLSRVDVTFTYLSLQDLLNVMHAAKELIT